jgi:hypothetical protein
MPGFLLFGFSLSPFMPLTTPEDIPQSSPAAAGRPPWPGNYLLPERVASHIKMHLSLWPALPAVPDLPEHEKFPFGPDGIKILPHSHADLLFSPDCPSHDNPAPPPETPISRPKTLWSAKALTQLDPIIRKYADVHGVEEKLIRAVISQESGFNPQAVSPKGAMGLMQLMPGTAELMGVQDPFDVEQNIAGGVKYLKLCMNRFNQDVSLALAAYNAGPENVVKYQGIPPFTETQEYVAIILQAYHGHAASRVNKRFPLKVALAQEDQWLLHDSGLEWQLPELQWKLAQPDLKSPPPQWKPGLLPEPHTSRTPGG